MNPQLQLMLQQAIEAFQGGNFERAATILRKDSFRSIPRICQPCISWA
ncbi:hypothetical protein [Polynucleobacter sp. MWH-P3-07-1]|nr:hypothetical protein [Polynucleobacter sp. MWH-P3-07-1]